MKKVRPRYYDGWNMSIAQLWGSGPKMTVCCGDCGGTFRKRIIMVDNPHLSCPYCEAINVLPIKIGHVGDPY